MKRSNPSITDATGKSHSATPRTPRLGALEFVAALNGEDTNGVLLALKRFANTVRNEKCEALGISYAEGEDDDDMPEEKSDQENDNDNEEEESEITGPPDAKKTKKNREEESWMKDTKSYNVPFVGTSVAKGDTGKVVVGQWPTGLLEKYLERSPFATELTGEALIPPSGYIHRNLLSRNEGKLSHAIHLAYLEALSELVTAAVPITFLRRQMGISQDDNDDDDDTENSETKEGKAKSISNVHGKFLTPILNERLEGLVDQIRAEIGKGKNTGKGTEKLGNLASYIIKILTNLAATSVTTSRRIIRILDEKITEKDLRILLRSKRGKEKENTKSSKPLTSTRTSCILLVATLLETGDTAVLSSLTRIGSKERKIQPGMLHSIMKFGLADASFDENPSVEQDAHRQHDESYFDAVGHLLTLIRNLLPSNENLVGDKPSFRGSNIEFLSKRTLADLLSGDALQRICQIAACAPPLSETITYETVLVYQDAYDEQGTTTLEVTGTEARRLLFPLLASSGSSPFLHRISTDNDNNRTASLYTQHVVRCLSFLLKSNNLIPIQAFVAHCLNNTPKLLPALFRALPIPDPKHPFSFISCSRLISRLLKDGPLPWENLSAFFESDKSKSNRAVGTDFVLLAISPLRMKKNILSKGLQSASTLVVLETLKLITAFLKRYQQLECHYKKQHQELWGRIEVSLEDAFLRLLPDMQALLAVRSRFDPFSTECRNPALDTILTGSLCQLIALYAKAIPRSVDRVKFDWMKLLPDDPTRFVEADPWLQLRLLDSLDVILDARKDCPGGTHHLSSNACRSFLSVAMASNRTRVYNIARKLSFKLIYANFCRGCTEEDRLECFKYESYLWIDGITSQSLDEFCLLFEKINQGAFQHAARIAEGWMRRSTAGYMEKPCISPLLSSALAFVPKSSKPFHLLTCQIAMKSLLFHRSPLPLASLICLQGEGPNWSKGDQDDDLKSTDQLLVNYSRHLLDFEANKVDERSRLVTSLVSRMFDVKSFYVKSIMHTLQHEKSTDIFRQVLANQYDFNSDDFQYDVSALLRSALHTIVTLGQSGAHETFQNSRWHHVTVILSMLLQNEKKYLNDAFIASLFNHPLLLHQRTPAFQCCLLDVLALGNLSNRQLPHPSLSRKLLKTSRSLSSSMSKFPDGDGHFRCKETRVALQNLSLLTTLTLERNHLSDVMQHLLRACHEGAETQENLSQMSLHGTFALNWMHNVGMKTGALSGVSVKVAFEAWRKIAGLHLLGPLSYEISQVCYFLEGCLGKVLMNESKSHSAAVVYALCLHIPPKDLVDLCLASKYVLLRKSAPPIRLRDSSNYCFLSSILRNDFRRVGPELLKRIETMGSTESNLKEMIKAGTLDEAMAVILEFPEASKMEFYGAISNCFVARTCEILNEMQKDTNCNQIVSSFSAFSNMEFCSLKPENFKLLLDETTAVLISMATKSLSNRDALVDYNLCKLGYALVSSRTYFKSKNPSSHQSMQSLASATLAGLCFASQQCLRRYYRRSSSLKVEHEDDTIQIMNLLENFLETIADYDEGILRKNDPIFSNFLRVSLKYGISNDEGYRGSITTSMLKVIRLIIVKFSNSIGLALFDPTQIFMMAASHSKFSSVLSEKSYSHENTPSELAKVELIYLLLCCVSLSKRKIIFERKTLETFLDGYTAGVGTIDIAMRRLIHLYLERTETTEPVFNEPFTDQLRWGGATRGSIMTNGENEQGGFDFHSKSWEWLLNHIELTRIRATLSQFPVWDQLAPPFLPDVETWMRTGLEDNGSVLVSLLASNGSNEETCNTPKDELNNTSGENRTVHEPPRSAWQGNGRDIRYSPAFLLPLIFRMVDSSRKFLDYEYEAKNVHNTEDDAELSPTRNSLALQAQQLCDKGVLALCLASLSCRCPSMRQISIAILYHLSCVLDWKEAHELTSWRERPQLLMILSSLQRGLVVRKSDRAEIESDGAEDGMIPLIPAVSAIFLARASLIIAKPGDSLYAPLNRYFLRIKSNFGAYNDLYRLPAFISLFCSSADEGQARRERLWALQQLKDGFVDKFCYRAVVSCHAPELVMTSFRGCASWHGDSDESLESILLLETLITLVKNGGNQAIYHLTVRLGLLSWIRTILVGRPTYQTLSSVDSQIAFLHLVSAVVHEVKEASQNQPIGQKTLLAEIESLASPVLQLYCSSTTGKDEKSDDHAKLIRSICNTLTSLRSAKMLLSSEANTSSAFRCTGISLSLSMRFLSAVPPSLLEEAVWSFCFLPLDIEATAVSDAIAFCNIVLGCAKHSEHLNSVLERVYLLTKTYASNLDNNGTILNLLLNVRGDYRGSDVWFRCISNLVTNQGSEVKLDMPELAREIVKIYDTATSEG